MGLWTTPASHLFSRGSGAGIASRPFSTIAKVERANDDLLSIYPKHKRFTPTVVFLMGRRDMGKTLTMSAMADIARRRYKRWKADFKIFSNYYLKFADGYSAHIIDEIMTYPSWARDMYLCIDEIQTAATSRRSMSSTNVNLATFLTMIRKRRIELVFTTQFPQVIDVQLLLQVDYFIECERNPQGTAVTLYVHDWWGQFTGKNWRKPWPPQRWEADEVKVLHGVQRIWGQYDTEQVIAPMYVDPYVRERLIDTESRGKDDQEYLEKLPMDEAYDRKMQLEEEEAAVVAAGGLQSVEQEAQGILARLPGRFNIRPIIEALEARGMNREAFLVWLKAAGYSLVKKGAATYAQKEGSDA